MADQSQPHDRSNFFLSIIYYEIEIFSGVNSGVISSFNIYYEIEIFSGAIFKIAVDLYIEIARSRVISLR